VSYLLQVRAIEREALAIQAQAPFVDEGVQLPTVAEALAEFDAWLISPPPDDRSVAPEDIERAEQYEAMGVRRRRD
jgi:hypothetical protein